MLTPEQIQFFRRNPSKAAEILLNVKLEWFQRVMLQTAWEKPFTLAICSRGIGKNLGWSLLVRFTLSFI